MKILDINKNIYELAKEYPELIDIMKELGFEGITNPFTLNTIGRTMTIPKGCAMKGIELEKVKTKLKEKDFKIKE